MQQANATPKDLADLVSRKLKRASDKFSIPNQLILNSLFENLFYASMKTEEGEFIKVTVTLIDSKNPDPSPPKRVVSDRWNAISFHEPIDFTVKNIVKLSKAADPWSSSLAVDFSENDNLFIWGMIDQAIHYQSFLHFEADEGPEQPGLFQISITEIGTLVVFFDYELIATLKQNVLISNYLDVFSEGPIYQLLKKNCITYKKKIASFVSKKFPDEDKDYWKQYSEDIWMQAICRLLIRIQGYKHGGAILITQYLRMDLDIKHKINYNRLFSSLKMLAEMSISNFIYSNTIHSSHIKNSKPLPVNLYLDESITEFTKKEIKDEIKGAIRFLASLSSIDGLVLLNKELEARGFGVVIKNVIVPDTIYLSKTSEIQEEKLIPVAPNSFGTRHRSMFSYCWKVKGSIGFVVSQDGDIRAITRYNDKLIVWENIKVQQIFKSAKLKRKTVPYKKENGS